MIFDQREGIPESITRGGIGFAAFCILMLAGIVAMFLNARSDQYCFAAVVDNWALRTARVCYLIELGVVPAALIGLKFDPKKLFAILTLGLSVPVFIIDAIAKGCW